METLLSEFVERVKAAAGSNLHSVVLYGSAASPEFHEKFSDVNLLCLLRDLSAPAMLALSETVAWWTKQKQTVPLLLAVEELKKSADVFPIELLDMQKHHRVLYGDDLIGTLEVPLRLHRIQVEHDLRTKLILLRQKFIAVSKENDKVLALMIDSLSSFVTLFRHTLIAMGEEPETGKRAMLQQLQRKTNIDVRSLLELLSVREGSLKPDALDVKTTFKSYLTSIEQVISAVDRL
jgi:predicted nucleotidyltransferase